MLSRIILFAFFASSANCSDNCNNFHEGIFIYQEGEYKGVKVHRSLSEQTEIIGDTITAYFFIKWVSDCSYMLIPNKVSYKSKENVLQKDTIKVNIIDVLSDTSYRYKAIQKDVATENIMVKVNAY